MFECIEKKKKKRRRKRRERKKKKKKNKNFFLNEVEKCLGNIELTKKNRIFNETSKKEKKLNEENFHKQLAAVITRTLTDKKTNKQTHPHRK